MTSTTATAGTRPRLRLTRRGRMLRSAVLALVLFVAVLLAAVAWGSDVVATSDGGQPVPVRTVTVQPARHCGTSRPTAVSVVIPATWCPGSRTSTPCPTPEACKSARAWRCRSRSERTAV
jgi:hypothetical protein